MKIGILGSGDVGRALGGGLANRGHQVMVGSREPTADRLVSWRRTLGPNVQLGSFAACATFGECAILATLWSGTPSALALAGPEHLAGKTVIDVTNPLLFTPGKPPELAIGHTDSGGEQVQRLLPRSHVVKAFNTVGHMHMVDPAFPGGPPDMFICGDDAEAKITVARLSRELGWPTVDVGGIAASRLLEPMSLLWIGHGLRTGTWKHAFKFLRG